MELNKIIAIASDHAGFELKELIKDHFKNNYKFLDYGTTDASSVDYPDYAALAVKAIEDKQVEQAILICGSGIGMCIAANRNKNIRAALCNTPELASLARKHNNANILVLGARFVTQATANQCVENFLTTEFEGGRHQERINKLS
jgi:ribose 5-phosphate isomerase B